MTTSSAASSGASRFSGGSGSAGSGERLTRHPERGSSQRADLDALLDSQWYGTLSTVTGDGRPWAVPML